MVGHRARMGEEALRGVVGQRRAVRAVDDDPATDEAASYRARAAAVTSFARSPSSGSGTTSNVRADRDRCSTVSQYDVGGRSGCSTAGYQRSPSLFWSPSIQSASRLTGWRAASNSIVRRPSSLAASSSGPIGLSMVVWMTVMRGSSGMRCATGG